MGINKIIDYKKPQKMNILWEVGNYSKSVILIVALQEENIPKNEVQEE